MILSFKPAVAADADAAVPLIYSSGPATFDFVFAPTGGDQALQFLHAAFRAGGGEFGYRNHVVALADGAIVGAGAAWDGRKTLAFTLAAAAQILRFYGPIGAAGVIARGLSVERVIRPPRGDEHYLAHLGVREDCRGRGVGAALAQHLLGAADPSRHRIASLDVAVTNPRAEALYARLGFSVLALRRSTLARGAAVVPDHRRMTLALG